MKKNRIKKDMEYDDAPSGFVTMYNYKEPFMKYEQGFGFQGVLLQDGESGKIQCHLCGNWFESLGNHLGREHNMYASDYKEMVGLSATTALISEKVREKLISSGMEKRKKNLKNRKGTVVTKETREKIRNTLKKNVRELQNLRGTCPMQLIANLQNKYKELGRTPSERDRGIRYDAIVNVFGSFKNACEFAGVPWVKPGTNRSYKHVTKWTDEIITDWVRNFLKANGSLPKSKDIPSGIDGVFYRKKNLKEEIFKKVTIEVSHIDKNGGFRYTKEDLLNYLRQFEKNHGRKPSYSDSKRGLIPLLSRYSYHFGSWQSALSLAFKK